jgi:glutamate--cysteine ligase
VEIECIFYNQAFRRLPVNPTNSFSATDFLNLVLQEVDVSICPESYSLEPGGQLEWASPPVTDLHTLNQCFQNHLHRLRRICKEQHLWHLGFSLEPLYQPGDIDLIDEEKYRLMHRRFQRTGSHGPWMMRNTTSVQVNIDLLSREDAEIMAFLSDTLQPFMALLFANSPFMAGKPAGKRNLRTWVWNHTDPSRCGQLLGHGIYKPLGLLDRFSEYVQTVPAIFVPAGDKAVVAYDGTLGAWLKSVEKQRVLKATDYLAALHQLFTHARFKTVLEVRGADRPPLGFEMAPVAFSIGLLTAEDTRNKLMEKVSRWEVQERKQLDNLATTLDLEQKGPEGRTLKSWIEELTTLALEGLAERSRRLKIKDEGTFLEPYLEHFFSQGIPALATQDLYQKSGLELKEFLMRELIHG